MRKFDNYPPIFLKCPQKCAFLTILVFLALHIFWCPFFNIQQKSAHIFKYVQCNTTLVGNTPRLLQFTLHRSRISVRYIYSYVILKQKRCPIYFYKTQNLLLCRAIIWKNLRYTDAVLKCGKSVKREVLMNKLYKFYMPHHFYKYR